MENFEYRVDADRPGLTSTDVIDILREGGACRHDDWEPGEYIWMDDSGSLRDEGMMYITLNLTTDDSGWRERELTYHNLQMHLTYMDNGPELSAAGDNA